MWIEGSDGQIERPEVLDGIEAFFCPDPPDQPGRLAARYRWTLRTSRVDDEERRRVAYHFGATPKIMDCFLGWDEESQRIITDGMRAAFEAAASHDPPLPIKTVAVGADYCGVSFVASSLPVVVVAGWMMPASLVAAARADVDVLTVMIAKPVVKAKVRP